MPKPFAATHRLREGKYVARKVVPQYNPASANADDSGWVYHKFYLHPTKGWRKA